MKIRLTRFQNSLLYAPFWGVLFYLIVCFVVFCASRFLGFELNSLFSLGLIGLMGVSFIITFPIAILILAFILYIGLAIALPMILLAKKYISNMLIYLLIGANSGWLLGVFLENMIGYKAHSMKVPVDEFSFILPSICVVGSIWYSGIRNSGRMVEL